jgi:hypothetical protein
MLSGNYCVELHYDIFGDYLTVQLDQINHYFLSQNLNNNQIWSNESEFSFLRLIAKVLVNFNSFNYLNPFFFFN